MDDPPPSAPATRPPRRRRLPRWALAALGLGALVVGAPLLLMVRAGYGGSAGQADGAVVLGARVYADGTPSLALAARCRFA